MKINEKLLYFALPILMLIFSCSKKDNQVETPVANPKLFNVSFNVSGFTTEVTPLPSFKSSAVNKTMDQAAAKLSDQITTLEYLIYNSSDQLLKDSIQTSRYADFGTINVQLPAGSYKLVVAGMSGSYDLLSKENIANAYITSIFPYGIGDWFKQVSDFKVTNNAVNQSVTLDREVGKIGFVLTDALPKDLAKISLNFTSCTRVRFYGSSDLLTEIQTVEFLLKPSQEGTLNFSSSTFVIPKYNGFITTDVSIRAYNTSGSLIVEKIIKDVVVEKNKMTTLSGALFTSLTSSTTTTVTINSDWKPSAIVTF
ncbi:MAG: hypothetical protein P0Y49_09700 [Candidatus Pedobacter colombiensis]|uniref:FimB/Mfa2 family fimbrial subunit n=1 Tax=Candidatus Pedobacter colombiensis TaxID=3121371 RepID=A0AAJ5WB98_9SPHI|nr:hypothetical protein [Pedobacter sp.]WEK21411.1 MAG: hypothetical protein P0Y49_09700 [Pedobacter sp.]